MTTAKAQTYQYNYTPGQIGSGAYGWDPDAGVTTGSNPSQQYGQAYGGESWSIAPKQGSVQYQPNGPNSDPSSAPLTVMPNQNMTGAAYRAMQLSPTSSRGLAPEIPKIKKIGAGNLPDTTLDSFVQQAVVRGTADAIYGDEGSTGAPGASTFSYISDGFTKQTREGLTTGHGGRMPSAWGDGWSTSGPSFAASQAGSTNVNAAPIKVPTN